MAAIISLALVYPLLWMKMLADPVQYTGADFIAFYAAGRIADREGADHVYDLNLQKKYQEEVVKQELELQDLLPYIHPPFVVPLAQIAVTPDFLQSFQRWAVMMIVIFSPGILLLMPLIQNFISRSQAVVFVIGLFLFFPLFQSIVLGQDNAIVFLGTSLLMWGLFQKKDWAAGLGLALTTVRPHFTLFLLLPILFKQRAALGWFIFFVFILGAISLAYTGMSGMEGFLRILTVSGSGEHYKTNEENMINFIGLARRTFPFFEPAQIRTAGWAGYVIAFLSLCIYYWRSKENLTGMDLSLAALAGIFFSPHTHVQDMILFIAPIMALISLLVKRQIIPPGRAVLLPLSISLTLLFSYYSPLLLHTIPYLLMIGFLIAIWHYQKDSPQAASS